MVTELAVCGVWMRMDLKYSLPKPGGMPLGFSGYLCVCRAHGEEGRHESRLGHRGRLW